MARFEDKVGFVTGGGTGIGLACAREISRGGGRVVLAGRREDVLREAAKELGPRADWVRCDVTSDESVEEAVSRVQQRHGGLHLAVNSAGKGGAGTVLNSTSAEFADVLDTNLVGVFRCMRAEARAMKAAGQHRQHQLDRGSAHAPLDGLLLRLQGGPQHAHALRGG